MANRKQMDSINSNYRLAKNTLFLYIRMFLIMGVSFYTTRIVLQVLGVTDYGIYNTIAGVVVLFTFLNNAMVTTTQRFLNFYLGKNDIESVSVCFNMSLFVHIAIGLILVILSETVGLWFLYNKMSLPQDRIDAAFWILQFATVTVFIDIVRSPYNACLVAYEKMDFYAYFSIAEALFKLAIVFVLLLTNTDKLILYGLLLMFVSFVILMIYSLYCNRNYDITHFKKQWDWNIFYQLFQFSGFSLLGNAANSGTQQGVNMIVNVFTGVITNAAIGVSNQLSHGIYNFVYNFQIAFNPIIVKTYAKNEFEDLKTLIYRVSKFSYFLMFMISLPVIMYCDEFLSLWLKTVPVYSSAFCKLTIFTLLVDTIAEPLWKTVQASGNIKRYQVTVSLIFLCNLPLTYLVLLFGGSPVCVFIAKFFLNVLAYIYRLYYSRRLINMSLTTYLKNTLIPVALISIISIVAAFLIYSINLNYIVGSVLMVVISFLVIAALGFTQGERSFIIIIVKQKMTK